MKVDKSLVASVALHVVVLGWGLFSFTSRAFDVVPEESLPVDVISADQFAKVTAGMKTGKKENTKPLAEKVADARPTDDAVGKISDKPPVVTDAAPDPTPPVEKPAENKPDPAKVDPIAEALKKQEAKKKPTPTSQAKTTPPPQVKKREYKYDANSIADLVTKRDPSRQAVAGDTLNSNAALGLAHGKAADNSATWGALFRQQVVGCWKKPDPGIQTELVDAEFSIKLRKDGTLEGMPVAASSPSGSFQRVFQESGLRAIIDCQPYHLPAQFFEEWKFFDPVFNSRDVLQ